MGAADVDEDPDVGCCFPVKRRCILIINATNEAEDLEVVVQNGYTMKQLMKLSVDAGLTVPQGGGNVRVAVAYQWMKENDFFTIKWVPKGKSARHFMISGPEVERVTAMPRGRPDRLFCYNEPVPPFYFIRIYGSSNPCTVWEKELKEVEKKKKKS